MSKTIFVVAGSIGSGKTTITNIILENPFFKDIEYINADMFARQFFDISPDNKANHELAKRYQIYKQKKLIRQGKDFLIELVPTKEKKVEILRDAKINHSYKIIIFYVYTDNVQINLSRVKRRNEKGDFFIREEEVTSRYDICNKNMPMLESLADELLLINNSADISD